MAGWLSWGAGALVGILLFWPGTGIGETKTRVFAVANSESFKGDLPELRYARQDMQRFLRVLRFTGAVGQEQITSLVNPSVQKMRETLRKLSQEKSEADGTPARLVFYYSGHSDATGLHMKDGLFRRDELQTMMHLSKHSTAIAHVIDFGF